MAKKKKKFYAYHVVGGPSGVADSWAECEGQTLGQNARYKGFLTRADAQAWLDMGANYEEKIKPKALDAYPEGALFFDAGTGGGGMTRARVTDVDGVPLTHLATKDVDSEGNVRLPGRTNNFGELLACCHAFKVAETLGSTHIYGDSKLVIEYWSLNRVRQAMRSDGDLDDLARETAARRRAFEARGGTLGRISGDLNPADLGFHKM